MKIFKQLVAPIMGALLLAGCANAPAVDAQENLPSICIISGEEATDGPTAQFMGQTVNFCCDRCKSRWDGMEDDARKAALADFNK